MSTVVSGTSIAGKPHARYERLMASAKGVSAAATIVVHPCDETSLRGGGGRHHQADACRPGGQDQRYR